jgi:hypothetical protein
LLGLLRIASFAAVVAGAVALAPRHAAAGCGERETKPQALEARRAEAAVTRNEGAEA